MKRVGKSSILRAPLRRRSCRSAGSTTPGTKHARLAAKVLGATRTSRLLGLRPPGAPVGDAGLGHSFVKAQWLSFMSESSQARCQAVKGQVRVHADLHPVSAYQFGKITSCTPTANIVHVSAPPAELQCHIMP